jgi:hypothetical protein
MKKYGVGSGGGSGGMEWDGEGNLAVQKNNKKDLASRCLKS